MFFRRLPIRSSLLLALALGFLQLGFKLRNAVPQLGILGFECLEPRAHSIDLGEYIFQRPHILEVPDTTLRTCFLAGNR